MQCPIDGGTLVISERSGVEIDYCPKCRGVWLDRGELDKILDRAGSEFSQRDNREARPAQSTHERYRDHDDDSSYASKKTRKKSFLSEIFEFGD